MVEQTVPATTDTKVLCLVRGPAIVSKDGLILDATYNTDAEKAAVYAALEAKGILCNDAV
jgi:predicted regulator of Ras-like GTPase activity (Roadblock/LC7/MglB family)